MGIHDGHRQRMKERFIESGLKSYNDHNALEMLLFYALPRKDTNELSHILLKRFGSLQAVLEADYEDLKAVDGVGENAAVLLRLIPEISRRYMERISEPKSGFNNISQIGKFFVSKFLYETDELSYAMFLDNAGSIISCKQISKGIVNATELSIRMLVEMAVKYKAAAVVISHNHPNGLPLPSAEDEQCTYTVKSALNLVGINLIDHIIVGNGRFCSLKTKGLM